MRIESLTFLRFIAAVIVVFFHFGRETYLAKALHPFMISGPQMVTFFFVLSGFVMVVSQFHKKQSLNAYYLSRIARIAPVYLLALAIMAYFFYGYGKNNTLGLLLSAGFLQAWFPPYPLSYNDPGWSLSVEMFFYLIFPALLFMLKRSSITPIKWLAGSVLFYMFSQLILINLITGDFNQGYQTFSFDLIYYFPLSHLSSFILGVAIGALYMEKGENWRRSGALSYVWVMVAAVLCYLLLQNTGWLFKVSGVALNDVPGFYAVFFMLLILSIACAKNIISKMLCLPFLVLLGEASYGVYILQKPVYMIYMTYISEQLSFAAVYDFYVYLTFLIVIAIMSLYLFERPAKRFIMRLKQRNAHKPLIK